jgi:hypothetical protein
VTTPARAARRQLLRDRFTELLTTWGSPHAEERARLLQDVVDELGFALPPALEDVPPMRGSDGPPSGPGYQAFRQALASLPRRDKPPLAFENRL